MKLFNKIFTLTLIMVLSISSVVTYAEEIMRPSAHGNTSKTMEGPGASIAASSKPLTHVYGTSQSPTTDSFFGTDVAAKEDINTFVSNFLNQKVTNKELINKNEIVNLLNSKFYDQTEIATVLGSINWADYIVININNIVNERNKEDITTKPKVISKHLEMGFIENEINVALSTCTNIDWDKLIDDTMREILAGSASASSSKVSERFIQNFIKRGLTEEEILASLSRIQGVKVEVSR